MKKQGRQSKEFSGDPLGAFLMDKFCRFAFHWPKKDLEKLCIGFDKNGWPTVGNVELINALFSIAAFPESDQESQELFFACYQRSPDFTLALITHLRREVDKLKDSKREILFGKSQEKFTDGQKQARSEIRKVVDEAQVNQEKALELLETELERNLQNAAKHRSR
jgi:hypothetical protein